MRHAYEGEKHEKAFLVTYADDILLTGYEQLIQRRSRPFALLTLDSMSPIKSRRVADVGTEGDLIEGSHKGTVKHGCIPYPCVIRNHIVRSAWREYSGSLNDWVFPLTHALSPRSSFLCIWQPWSFRRVCRCSCARAGTCVGYYRAQVPSACMNCSRGSLCVRALSPLALVLAGRNT